MCRKIELNDVIFGNLHSIFMCDEADKKSDHSCLLHKNEQKEQQVMCEVMPRP